MSLQNMESVAKIAIVKKMVSVMPLLKLFIFCVLILFFSDFDKGFEYLDKDTTFPDSEYEDYYNLEIKIVGGEESGKNHWPWTAALLDKKNKVFCGGSLIEPFHILTAAHCLNPKEK